MYTLYECWGLNTLLEHAASPDVFGVTVSSGYLQFVGSKSLSCSGLGVACWPLVPKFAGSNPAEAVGFLRAKKNPQHAFLRRGSKAVGPMS